MRIREAKWEDGWLKLKTADVDARHFAYKFKDEGEWELKPKKDLRSLDANAYMWVLCEKIAKAVGIETMPPAQLESLMREWEKHEAKKQ